MSAPRVTATHIRNWAKDRTAQGLLPVLVRRLIQATSTTRGLTLAGGDAVALSGFDGVVRVSSGCAWVSEGKSVWEMGCDQKPATKAEKDFMKRESDADADTEFIFVTPRLWTKKVEWAAVVRSKKLWKDVRVFDATDLEAWLESAPGVHLWFAEELGIAGDGVETPDHAWSSWSSQTSPAISPHALMAGRDESVRRLVDAIETKKTIIRIRADSSEEASAFASLILSTRFPHRAAVVVTDKGGWRFVDANEGVDIAVAASGNAATVRAPRDGFTLIVPASKPASNVHEGSGETIMLDRAAHRDFEAALVQMGRDPADAVRLSSSSGRSWSVYRRIHSTNPGIKHPAWLDDASLLRTLCTLTLLGRWNGASSGDQVCVAEVDGRSYEDLEQDLRRLSLMDDAPVLQIGHVWHARAPLELIYMIGPRLTHAQLDRFFKVAYAVLALPDPALELADDKRWMAQVYGKTREQSGLVLDALAESLTKLSVYAERSSDPQRVRILSGVDRLVELLLARATAERWLSLSGLLPELAEASPDVFLAAVQRSLASADAPVRRLCEETSGSDIGSRAWHTGLLWALEILAWAPNRLAAVSMILADLSATPIKGNWTNTPGNSLKSLYRTWWPQTAASLEQRMGVLDGLLQRFPKAAWRLVVDLLSRDDIASQNAMPKWRDDNAGAIESATDRAVVVDSGRAVRQRAIATALASPELAIDLIDCLAWFEPSNDTELVELFERAKALPDADRAAIRSRLRSKMSWHNSFDKNRDSPSGRLIGLLSPYFDALAPEDVILRNAWVFESGWVDLPEGKEDHDSVDRLRQERRTTAWAEVSAEKGLDGALELVRLGADARLIGWEVAHQERPVTELGAWIARLHTAQAHDADRFLIAGVLHGLQADIRREVLEAARTVVGERHMARLLVLAPATQSTWDYLMGLDESTQESYWSQVPPGFFRDGDVDGEFMIQQFVRRARARSAFQILSHSGNSYDAALGVELLQRIAAGEEPDGPMPRPWDITEAIDKAGKISADRRRLAVVELQFHGAFSHGDRNPSNLYAEMLSDPEFFVEIAATAARPPRAEDGETDGNSRQTAWEVTFSVMRNGKGAPGTRADGTIDAAVFYNWVDEVRRLAQARDVSAPVEVALGEWFARVRVPNDSWPPAPIRDALESGPDAMRRGFSTGIFNSRGMTSREVYEGGVQERALAERYRADATPLELSHPKVAQVLLGVAQSYERHGRDEDDDAQLLRERP